MKNLLYIILIALFMAACSSNGKESASGDANSYAPPAPANEVSANTSDPMSNKGIGPVKEVTLGELDQQLAAEGAEIYQQKCTACHKPDKKFIGPAPKGIFERRSPEWVMNMILNPSEMLEKDPIAKQLLLEANGAPMADQNLTEEEARKVLEYFRTL